MTAEARARFEELRRAMPKVCRELLGDVVTLLEADDTAAAIVAWETLRVTAENAQRIVTVHDALEHARRRELEGLEIPEPKDTPYVRPPRVGPSPSLTAEQRRDVIARHLAGESQRSIAEHYGVSAPTIHRAIYGRTS